MKFADVFAFAKQESAQVFVLAVAALWIFWKADAPDQILWMVGGIGALFVVFEKVRSMRHPRPPS